MGVEGEVSISERSSLVKVVLGLESIEAAEACVTDRARVLIGSSGMGFSG
jgi:putative ribosome biogenesis GTPase RsgA